MKKLILFLPVLLCCLLVTGFSGNAKRPLPKLPAKETFSTELLMCPGIFEPMLNS